jgi:hypothetical protein
MRIAAVGMLWVCMAGYVSSQPSATQAIFEVASVKPSEPGVLGLFTSFLPDGGVHITGATMKDLVAIAYNVRVFQISGGPAWIGTEHFDVDARAVTLSATAPGDPPKVSVEQRKQANGSGIYWPAVSNWRSIVRQRNSTCMSWLSPRAEPKFRNPWKART